MLTTAEGSATWRHNQASRSCTIHIQSRDLSSMQAGVSYHNGDNLYTTTTTIRHTQCHSSPYKAPIHTHSRQ